MKFDVSHVEDLSNLLALVKEAMGHPKLKPIADEAMKYLEEYAENLGKMEEPVGEPAPEPEKEEYSYASR